MFQLRHPRRPRRSGEWTNDKAVTFIVTLAASRSVTLAARRAGMSRKSAYALKARDPAFAAAWRAAIDARPAARRKGDKVSEAHDPRISLGQGDRPPARNNLGRDRFARDLFFARLAGRDSGPVADTAPAQ